MQTAAAAVPLEEEFDAELPAGNPELAVTDPGEPGLLAAAPPVGGYTSSPLTQPYISGL